MTRKEQSPDYYRQKSRMMMFFGDFGRPLLHSHDIFLLVPYKDVSVLFEREFLVNFHSHMINLTAIIIIFSY